ncbi:MAG: DUF1427 family protein [Vibrio sp.]
MKIALGLLLGFCIGIGCQLFGIPLPAPPVLVGGLLVLSMTVGYTLTDKFLQHRPAKQKKNCGGH